VASDIQFFETPRALRAWLRKNHGKAAELHVGYFKNHTGQRGVTWPSMECAGRSTMIATRCDSLRGSPEARGAL
jgi:hypothetical protein